MALCLCENDPFAALHSPAQHLSQFFPSHSPPFCRGLTPTHRSTPACCLLPSFTFEFFVNPKLMQSTDSKAALQQSGNGGQPTASFPCTCSQPCPLTGNWRCACLSALHALKDLASSQPHKSASKAVVQSADGSGRRRLLRCAAAGRALSANRAGGGRRCWRICAGRSHLQARVGRGDTAASTRHLPGASDRPDGTSGPNSNMQNLPTLPPTATQEQLPRSSPSPQSRQNRLHPPLRQSPWSCLRRWRWRCRRLPRPPPRAVPGAGPAAAPAARPPRCRSGAGGARAGRQPRPRGCRRRPLGWG